MYLADPSLATEYNYENDQQEVSSNRGTLTMWGSLSYVKTSDGFLMSVIRFVGYKQKGQWSVSDKGPEPNMA